MRLTDKDLTGKSGLGVSNSEKIFYKISKKYLVGTEKGCNFALANRAISSAGLERLSYKQRVCGSNP